MLIEYDMSESRAPAERNVKFYVIDVFTAAKRTNLRRYLLEQGRRFFSATAGQRIF